MRTHRYVNRILLGFVGPGAGGQGETASTTGVQQLDECAFDAPGFVENVNKYLLGPAPPRATKVSLSLGTKRGHMLCTF